MGESGAVRMKGISKSYHGVTVLREVDFELAAGEVHALMGENGAGKSTLMKILAGIESPDAGSIEVDGRAVKVTSPQNALALGIGIIHQELNLSPNLTVAENIFMGREQRDRYGCIDRAKMNRDAQKELSALGAQFRPSVLVRTLSVAEQQLVEIAKSLSQHARVLIMDEPTAALTDRESEKLFQIIRRLCDLKAAIVYISHRMDEVYAIADKITVLRDGCLVSSNAMTEITPHDIILQMVGRSVSDLYTHQSAPIGNTALEVCGITDGGFIKPCSITVKYGEIVGLAGLVGSGRTELVRLIFGADRRRAGEIRLDGKALSISEPRDAIGSRIALLPESRKEQGLFLKLAIRENIGLASLSSFAVRGVVNFTTLTRIAREYMANLRIQSSSILQKVGDLSGGNQQKVALAKWLQLKPKVLILDEPTRGVDVGAKSEIYRIISRLANDGVAILMISSELPELLGMSDRILVMHEGEIVAELPAGASQQEVMRYATGLDTETASVSQDRTNQAEPGPFPRHN
jgi:ribose transport system ATP-binding protein